MIAFSSETMQARRKWNDLFSDERKTHQPRILYPAKLSFSSEGEMKAS